MHISLSMVMILRYHNTTKLPHTTCITPTIQDIACMVLMVKARAPLLMVQGVVRELGEAPVLRRKSRQGPVKVQRVQTSLFIISPSI